MNPLVALAHASGHLHGHSEVLGSVVAIAIFLVTIGVSAFSGKRS